MPKAHSDEEVAKLRGGAVDNFANALLKDKTKEEELELRPQATALAQQIEEAVFALSNNQVDNNYKQLYRQLVLNLNHPKNTRLRARIWSSELTPSALVRLSPEELVPEEIQNVQRVHQPPPSEQSSVPAVSQSSSS